MLTYTRVVGPPLAHEQAALAQWLDRRGAAAVSVTITASAAEFAAAGAMLSRDGSLAPGEALEVALAAVAAEADQPTVVLDAAESAPLLAQAAAAVRAREAARQAAIAAAEAEKRASAAKSAAAAAKAAAKRAAVTQWIAAHGSDYLRRLVAEGMPHESEFRAEYLARERPGWEPGYGCGHAPPYSVTPALLAALDAARVVEPEASIVRGSDDRPTVVADHPLVGMIRVRPQKENNT